MTRLFPHWVVLLAMLSFFGATTLAYAQTAPANDAAILPSAADQTILPDVLAILLPPMTAEELAGLASEWQKTVKQNAEETASLNLAVLRSSEAEATVLREQIVSLNDRQTVLIDNYTLVLDAWELKGGGVEEIEVHRVYLSALRVAAVRSIDPKTLISLAVDWLLSVQGGVALLGKIAGIIVAIFALKTVARIVRGFTARSLNRIPDISQLLRTYVLVVIYWLTFFVGLMLVLTFMGINVTPLFAVFGGLSFIVGFAMQETLGNFASGLLIMVLKPFDLGDYIESAGTAGTVDAMSIVSTTIRTFDNQIIIVPNSKIWGDVITNVNAEDTRRVDLVFGIGYSDSIEQAIAVLTRVVGDHVLCLDDPEPAFGVAELGDSSVNLYCRPWVNTPDYWTVYWDLTSIVKEEFDAAGISIPFPQRDVHLVQATDQEPSP